MITTKEFLKNNSLFTVQFL